MAKPKKTMIVVMDSAQARFFELGARGMIQRNSGPVLESDIARHARDERSDKPGRSLSARGNGERHAIEPKHDYHKLAKRAFVKAVANEITAEFAARAFERLLLVAPRRTLGELRKFLTGRVSTAVVGEIEKDLAALPDRELWTRIAPALLRDANMPDAEIEVGRSDRPATASGTVVLFRDLKPSAAIEASIRKHALKLDRIHDRILSCKAVVEGSHGHHRKGHLYRVHVDVRIPGRRINAASERRQEFAHEDVYAAIRDAFAAVGRQLQDYVRLASGRPSQQRRSSSLRSLRTDTP